MIGRRGGAESKEKRGEDERLKCVLRSMTTSLHPFGKL